MSRSRTLAIAASILSAVILGGCISGGTEEDATTSPSPSSTSPSPSGSSSPTTTAAPPPENNTAPELSFTPIVGADNSSLNVSFLLNATDADGDDLSWTLDADGDGQADETGGSPDLPKNYTHVYSAPGSYNATFEVSDGTVIVNETITVNVTAAAVSLEDLIFEGTITGAWLPAAGYLADGETHTFDLQTQPTSITFTIEWGATATDLDLYVLDPAGEEVGAANLINPVDAVGEDPIVIDDPDILSRFGTWTLQIEAGASAEGDYTVTVDFA